MLVNLGVSKIEVIDGGEREGREEKKSEGGK